MIGPYSDIRKKDFIKLGIVPLPASSAVPVIAKIDVAVSVFIAGKLYDGYRLYRAAKSIPSTVPRDEMQPPKPVDLIRLWDPIKDEWMSFARWWNENVWLKLFLGGLSIPEKAVVASLGKGGRVAGQTSTSSSEDERLQRVFRSMKAEEITYANSTNKSNMAAAHESAFKIAIALSDIAGSPITNAVTSLAARNRALFWFELAKRHAEAVGNYAGAAQALLEAGRMQAKAGAVSDTVRLFNEASSEFLLGKRKIDAARAKYELAKTLVDMEQKGKTNELSSNHVLGAAIEPAFEASRMFEESYFIKDAISATILAGDIQLHLGMVREALVSYQRASVLVAKIPDRTERSQFLEQARQKRRHAQEIYNGYKANARKAMAEGQKTLEAGEDESTLSRALQQFDSAVDNLTSYIEHAPVGVEVTNADKRLLVDAIYRASMARVKLAFRMGRPVDAFSPLIRALNTAIEYGTPERQEELATLLGSVIVKVGLPTLIEHPPEISKAIINKIAATASPTIPVNIIHRYLVGGAIAAALEVAAGRYADAEKRLDALAKCAGGYRAVEPELLAQINALSITLRNYLGKK